MRRELILITLLMLPATAGRAQTCPIGAGPDGQVDGLRQVLHTLHDPTVKAAATGATLGCLEGTAAGQWAMAHARTLPVPSVLQGNLPACPIAALTMVLDYWRDVTGGQVRAPGSGLEPGAAYGVLQDAEASHFTPSEGAEVGSFSSMEDLATEAQHWGFEAAVATGHLLGLVGPSIRSLEKSIDEGIPPIVTCYVDDHGCPTSNEKGMAHAAVVLGFAEDDEGRKYLVVKHGFRKEPFLWAVDDFRKSWRQAGTETVTVTPTEQSLN